MASVITYILNAPRWVHYGIAAALAVAAFLWWLDSYGDKRVATAEAETAVKVIAASQAANDKANANDAVRQFDNALASERTRKALSDAEAAHSDSARLPAGPVSRAVTDSLRDRSAKARAAAD